MHSTVSDPPTVPLAAYCAHMLHSQAHVPMLLAAYAIFILQLKSKYTI